jgi:hypothetical protein
MSFAVLLVLPACFVLLTCLLHPSYLRASSFLPACIILLTCLFRPSQLPASSFLLACWIFCLCRTVLLACMSDSACVVLLAFSLNFLHAITCLILSSYLPASS